MDKWEYNIFDWLENPINNMLKLNQLGKDGWMLVQVVSGFAIMSRKVVNEKKDKVEKEKDSILFESCWVDYRRKGSKKKSLEQWLRLTKEEQGKVQEHIKAYVESVSDIKYQKDFERYLRDKCFLNVVYKDGKTLFDIEKREDEKSDVVVVNGQIYR